MLKGLTQEHEQYCIAENAANIIKNAINWMPIIIVLFSRWNEILCKKTSYIFVNFFVSFWIIFLLKRNDLFFLHLLGSHNAASSTKDIGNTTLAWPCYSNASAFLFKVLNWLVKQAWVLCSIQQSLKVVQLCTRELWFLVFLNQFSWTNIFYVPCSW